MDALNGVKLDLALAVSLCVLAALLSAVLPLPRWADFALLASVAVGSALWVVLRTRRVVQRHAPGDDAGRP